MRHEHHFAICEGESKWQTRLNEACQLVFKLALLTGCAEAGPCGEGVLPVHGGHVLPHQHAQPVAVVVPAVRLHLCIVNSSVHPGHSLSRQAQCQGGQEYPCLQLYTREHPSSHKQKDAHKVLP